MAPNLVPRSSNDRWEDSPGSVVAAESCLAHSGAVVNNQRGNFVIRHLVFLVSTTIRWENEFNPLNML